MLRALHQGVASVLSVVVLLHLRVVLAIVADGGLCGRVFIGWADESSEVRLALSIIHCAVFVQSAVKAVIHSRVVVIKLSVVKVSVLSFAVGVLVCFIIEPPIPGCVFNLGGIVNPECIFSLAAKRRGSSHVTGCAWIGICNLVEGVPLSCVGRGEVIPLQLTRLSLEWAGQVVTSVSCEVISGECAEAETPVVGIAVLALLSLELGQTSIVEVQVENLFVGGHGLSLTPADRPGWETETSVQVFAVHALLLCVRVMRPTIECEMTQFARYWYSCNIFDLLFINVRTFSVQVLLTWRALQVVEEVLRSTIGLPISGIACFAVLTVPGGRTVSQDTGVFCL